MRNALLLALISSISGTLSAQLTTGTIAGTVRDDDGTPVAAVTVVVSGVAGFQATTRTNSEGEFILTVPYGRYELSVEAPRVSQPFHATISVAPLQTTRINLAVNALHIVEARSTSEPGLWAETPRQGTYPQAFDLQGVLLSHEPATAAEPLDFAGLQNHRLGVLSQRGFSWTGTQYKLAGMDATDSFQPGRPAILPDSDSLEYIVVRSGFAQTTSKAYATEAGLFLPEPAESWHGAISTVGTGSFLASSNLPVPAARGIVQQPERFNWFTRDHLEAGGPLAKWADLFASASGQWASQTVPIANPGNDPRNDLTSRLLFVDSRLRVQLRPPDQLEVQYSGSRQDLSGWAEPAGIEDLVGRRMAPFFVLPWGFQNETEADQFHFLQVGWTHLWDAGSDWGALQVRYQYSDAHLDTKPAFPVSSQQSRIELLGSGVTGAPPLANLASRTRQQIEAVWQPVAFRAAAARHHVLVGAGWEASSPRNRFSTPLDMNLITANGASAFAVEFNTPLDSREIVRSFSLTASNHLLLGTALSIDLGGVADFSRGSLPRQASSAGTFAGSRTFASQPDLIAWNSVSPRAGFAWQVPHAHGLVLRGAYFRVDAPLAGRYLDFANSNSLGGSVYRWTDLNSDGLFQPGELGPLLLNFGGPYSSISQPLRRPYADEFDIGAQITLARWLALSLQLFRRDDKKRIAALDTGVTPQAFSPHVFLDPGPDGIRGTFDDQRLTVYEQNPATFGQNRYLLTNPAGLRELNKGIQAQVDLTARRLTLRASFAAEQTYGATSPGDAPFENDPGIVATAFLDPNSAIQAAGRSFMDRAFVGKILANYRLPSRLGGLELGSVTDYLDGLVFARYLLVTGLAQGPFLVATTSRGTQPGNPQGGNRAQGVINWNLRLRRNFKLPVGRLTAAVDILNVINSGYKIQESDLSGASFNLRLPVEIQSPRFVRLEVRYEF